MPEDFSEGVYQEEKILTGGLKENIKYWVRKDGEAFILEYLRLDGASTNMEAERFSPEDFQKRFEKTIETPPEEEQSEEEVREKKLVRQGEIHLEKEEFHSAEYEFKNALKVNETSVKASFGLGQSYSGQGKTEEAREVFSKLGDNEDLYQEKNKHTFNELGIALRREKMYDDAIRNYHRAIQLDPNDPILQYNISLSLYRAKRVEEAQRFLSTSLELDGSFMEARKLMRLIDENG